jgi:transcriptional regulator with XRE-family HTH domain
MGVKRDKVAEIDLEVAFRIRRLREEAGMSQMDLAERIGLSYQQVQKYESGKNKVSLERLCQIAAVFNIDATFCRRRGSRGKRRQCPHLF